MIIKSSVINSPHLEDKDLNMESVLRRFGRNKLTSESDEPGPSEIEVEASGPDDVMAAKDASDDEEEKKRKSISIDITKALVILGFSNWSELDLGMNYTV